MHNEKLLLSKIENNNTLFNIDFDDINKFFSQLTNSSNITKTTFENIFFEFQQKTKKQWIYILQSMNNFIETKKIKDVEDIACILLFIEDTIQKENDNAWKKIKILQKKYPDILKKLINSFRTQTINKIQKTDQDNKKQDLNNKETDQDNKEIDQDNKEKTKKDWLIEINTKNINKITQKIKEQIKENAPEYIKPIQEKANNIKKQYPQLSEDESYLLSVANEYEYNTDFAKKIKLDEQFFYVIHSVQEKYSNLKIEHISNTKQIESNISIFANEKTDYDDKIEESIEIWNLDLNNHKNLSKKYPNIVENFFNKIKEKYNWINIQDLKENYNLYLQWQITRYDAVYKKLWELLQQNIKKDIKDYTKEYKKISLQNYIKTIFSMFEHTIWLENTNFDWKDFNIKNSGDINISFNYEWTPLKLKIENGDIFITNFLSKENEDPNHIDIKENGNFQVKQTKINHFFKFPSLQDILSPQKWSIKIENLTWENIQTLVEKNIQNKLNSINALWNKEIMKTEIKEHIKRQAITYKVLNTYRPPFADDHYMKWNYWKIWEDKSGLYYILWRIDKTIRYEENWLEKLIQAFENSKFQELLYSINWQEIWFWEKLSTYKFFEKLWLLGKNWTLNIIKLEQFVNNLQIINNKNDINKINNKYPMEWLEITKENDKLKITTQNQNDTFLELDKKLQNYTNIKI